MLKICLTGGPSTGKTSVINAINKYFTELGYHVIIIPEAATTFINSGIRPFGENALPAVEFQKLIIDLQMQHEKITDEAAKIIGSDKTIIVCDRGLLDGIAYVTSNEWNEVLTSKGLNTRELLMNYDCILYMESAEFLFTKENNEARYENDAAEAIEKGQKVLKSYLSHDNLKVIQPREDIKDKEREVVNVISNMLGLPTRLRNQKKFLVDGVDVSELAKNASKVVIKQDYLKCEDNNEYRVRRVEQNGSYSYHFSIIKQHTNGVREILKDSSIDEKTYNSLLLIKTDESVSLTKTRYSFVHDKQYFKLDVFEDGLVLLEVNLTKENPNLSIPEYVNVIDDVTNDNEYKNINIARRMMTTYGKRENNSNRGHRLLRETNSI